MGSGQWGNWLADGSWRMADVDDEAVVACYGLSAIKARGSMVKRLGSTTVAR